MSKKKSELRKGGGIYTLSAQRLIVSLKLSKTTTAKTMEIFNFV